MDKISTWIATSNIALIKYWGKRDERLILPHNSSLSITLDENLSTKTSIIFSDKIDKDMFYLNGKPELVSGEGANERLKVVDSLRKMAKVKAHFLAASVNSFPTAGGLASSASGVAALVLAAADALDLDLAKKELSIIARSGSGSACRSIFGGFVKWNRGSKEDGSDSFAEQIADHRHWPEIIDLIAIVSEKEKKISSRAGMKQTVENSILYSSRVEYAEKAVVELAEAIKKKDFERLAYLIMRDSNNMHAVMLDTWPPIFYMNDVSREIVYRINDLNANENRNIAAYTFDAGPNAHIITRKGDKNKVIDAIRDIEGVRLIEAGVGAGPKVSKEHLIDEHRLVPIGV
ncbi:MAG: diphosphomevalonate decarboxylase [Candidatus Micrarchaeaceae archaeon]